MSDVDPRTAAAESQLQQLDDRRLAGDGPVDKPSSLTADPATDGIDTDGYGFHLDDPEVDLLRDEPDVSLHDDGEADALDLVADAFNVRNLERVLDTLAPDAEVPGLLGYDRDNVAEAIQDLWQRRPSGCLTRGHVGVDDVGVLWEHDGAQWWRVAVVHVDDVVDGRIGVLEFSDDPDLLEQVQVDEPDDEHEEGSRWSEWAEGDGGDD